MLIAIRHYRIELRDGFAPGKVLTLVEAEHLNRLRGEAIKEIWRSQVPSSPLLSHEELKHLRSQIADYDRNYSLPVLRTLKLPYTLDEELDLLRSQGYRGSDLEALARRRFATRIGLGPEPSLEDLI
jgi:hypothetical protein